MSIHYNSHGIMETVDSHGCAVRIQDVMCMPTLLLLLELTEAVI